MGSLADAAEVGADAVNLAVDNDWLDLHDEAEALSWAERYGRPLTSVSMETVRQAVPSLGEGYERAVYMGIGPIRLFRSEDTGKSWEPLDGMLEFGDDVKRKWDVPPRLRGIESPHVRHVFIHPDNQNLIWVLLEHGGNLLSRDLVLSWKHRRPGGPRPGGRRANPPAPGRLGPWGSSAPRGTPVAFPRTTRESPVLRPRGRLDLAAG